MSATGSGFEDFMRRRLAASTAFVEGDIAPLDAISATEPPATIFGPAGGTVQGPEQVGTVNAAGAARFGPGGSNAFEVLHSAADEHLAYWTGLQHSVVRVRDVEEPVPMELRVTEVFRRDGAGEWVLVHRHADQLVDPPG